MYPKIREDGEKMGIFSKVKSVFSNHSDASIIEDEPIAEDEPMRGWLTMDELAERYKATPSAAGALFSVGTVFACVNYRARMLAKLPFQVFHKELIKNGEGAETEQRFRADIDYPIRQLLERRPNKYQTPTMYKQFIMTNVLTRGFCVVYKKYDAYGNITELIPWKSQEVGVEKLLDKDEYVYSYRGQQYTEDEVIYIPYLSADGKRGISPLAVARGQIEAVREMDKHLRGFYESGAVKKGALKMTQPLSNDAKKKLKKSWKELYGGGGNSGEIAILDNGIEWADISLPMTDIQFIESKQLTAKEIAAIFDVPPSAIGLAQEKYSNLQEINDRFIQDVVAPDCINIEEAHNFSLFLKDERKYYTKFNISAGMRGSAEKRIAYYEKMVQMGVLTINEVRAMEEMNGIGELGDKHYASLNYTTLDTLEKHERIKEN